MNRLMQLLFAPQIDYHHIYAIEAANIKKARAYVKNQLILILNQLIK